MSYLARGVGQAVVTAALLLLGCHHAFRVDGTEQEYRFVHFETTGLTTGLLAPASVHPGGTTKRPTQLTIQFSRDSNEEAVKALFALDYAVLAPNANADRDEDGIVLVGVLDSKVQHTPTGPRQAESEPFQDFRLSRWYLHAPFLRLQREPTPLDDSPPLILHDDQLRAEDFGGPIAGSLSRFVRSDTMTTPR